MHALQLVLLVLALLLVLLVLALLVLALLEVPAPSAVPSAGARSGRPACLQHLRLLRQLPRMQLQ